MPTIVTQPDERLIQRRVCLCPVPTDTLSNATYANITYTGGTSGTLLDYMEKTVDSVTYSLTLTYTGNNLTSTSGWVAV